MSEEKNGLKCGLVMPLRDVDGYEPRHFLSVQAFLKDKIEEIDEFDFTAKMVSSENTPNLIPGNIVKNLANDDLVIVDTSSKNPNVMIELGMRLAFDKPTIVIQEEGETFEFDISSLEHLTYPRSLEYIGMRDFGKKLKKAIISLMREANEKGNTFSQYLKQFGSYEVSLPTTTINSDSAALQVILERLDSISMQQSNIQANLSNKKANSLSHENLHKHNLLSKISTYPVIDDENTFSDSEISIQKQIDKFEDAITQLPNLHVKTLDITTSVNQEYLVGLFELTNILTGKSVTKSFIIPHNLTRDYMREVLLEIKESLDL